MSKATSPQNQRDFTGGGIFSLSSKRGSTGKEEFDRRVEQLVADWDGGENHELIEELIITALRIGSDDVCEADLKLFNRTLKELQATSYVFAPYDRERKVAIYGSARSQPGQPEYEAAKEFADKMREHGFMTITGAGEGIMGAAQEGAGRENSFGLNIKLPFEQSANDTIIGDHKLLTFNYFFTRKLAFVKESDATVLFPGGFGTMDECFEVLTLMQTGKASVFPVVMVDAPGGSYWKTFEQFIREHLFRLKLISEEDFNLFKITDSVDEAVAEVLHFYRVFHSYRYVRDKMVIRLNRNIHSQAVDQLNLDFADLIVSGKIKQRAALKEESNERAIIELPRLVFRVERSRPGRIRELLDAINNCDA